MSQLSQDLSHAELELKAAGHSKAAAGRDGPSTTQQALMQQVKALNARVGSGTTLCVHHPTSPCKHIEVSMLR